MRTTWRAEYICVSNHHKFRQVINQKCSVRNSDSCHCKCPGSVSVLFTDLA